MRAGVEGSKFMKIKWEILSWRQSLSSLRRRWQSPMFAIKIMSFCWTFGLIITQKNRRLSQWRWTRDSPVIGKRCLSMKGAPQHTINYSGDGNNSHSLEKRENDRRSRMKLVLNFKSSLSSYIFLFPIIIRDFIRFMSIFSGN